jgi:hypothetical protein
MAKAQMVTTQDEFAEILEDDLMTAITEAFAEPEFHDYRHLIRDRVPIALWPDPLCSHLFKLAMWIRQVRLDGDNGQ